MTQDNRPAMPLRMANAGEEVILAEVLGGKDLQHRLAEMGLLPGAQFTIVSPGKSGPFIIMLKGTKLMLGLGMVHKIMIKPAWFKDFELDFNNKI